MPHDRRAGQDLEAAVLARLETIVDPCSVAAGAPAGLVSMGLVGGVSAEPREGGIHLEVTLRVTEPACLMGAIFEANARRELAALPGVASVEVRVDRTHLWSPDDMAAAYRRRLDDYRVAQSVHSTSLRQAANQTKGGT